MSIFFFVFRRFPGPDYHRARPLDNRGKILSNFRMRLDLDSPRESKSREMKTHARGIKKKREWKGSESPRERFNWKKSGIQNLRANKRNELHRDDVSCDA